MTEREAISELLELAMDRISTIDGEWGCCHTFEEALTQRREREEWDDPEDDLTLSCPMHEEAVKVADLAAVLGFDLRASRDAGSGS